MATGFSTRSGPDGYRLNFDTDNLDYYLLMQKIARHCVDGKPAADVAPVRHGRWEPGNPICPVCGENKFKDLDADVWADWQPKFCPNCGALMDGKEDEHEVSES